MIKPEELEKDYIVTQKDVNEEIERNPNMQWFIVQTYSGKDLAAKKSILERLKTTGIEDSVGLVVMAEKKVTDFKNGRISVVKKKLYPGYLYVYAKTMPDSNMMDEKVYFAIKGASNVHTFVNQRNSGLPQAIVNKLEIRKMISQLQDGETVEDGIKLKIGNKVIITEGNFKDFNGEIVDINYQKNIATVEIPIFGKITPVNDLSLEHLKNLEQ